MSSTKFVIEDEVRLKSNKDIVGNIKQIVSVLSNGNSLYLVNFKHGLKMITEKELEFNKDSIEVTNNFNFKDFGIAIEVDDKINEIINELGLVNSSRKRDVYENACKLQEYLISSSTVVKKYVGASSNSVVYNELYNGLIIGDRNYLTNSLIFKEVMNKLKADVLMVALMNSEGKFYVSNLVLLGDEYYYFDVSLDIEVYLESDEDSKLELHCVGIGKDRYERYFKPLNILDFDTSVSNKKLPENISLSDFKM